MKKKLFVISACICLILGLTACGASVSYDDLDLDEYIKVGKYKGLETEAFTVEVTDEEIQAQIDSELEAAAASEEIPKGDVIADGDTVNIDYVGKKDGKKFDGGSAEGHDLVIGSDSFIDGFEDGLIGRKVGDKVKLELTFPEDYGESSLAGQDVVFTVKINSATRVITPEYDISFVKSTTEYDSIEAYETLNKRLEEVEETKIDLTSRFKEVNKSLMFKEDSLRDSLNIMGLDLGNLLDIDLYIKEYKDKIRKKEEVHANLLSMEETYKALLKDRNIAEIKKDLQNVINDNNDYEYESEDDIEKEEKKKSQELLECEKYIKDIENKISTRYIGKRSLPEIEEELDSMASEIKVSENKVKALDIAIDTMKESFDEIRRDIGPALNSNIADIFRILTGDKYIEVKLGENYEMTVRDNLNLFKGNYLSNGASDQLYLALRIALVGLIFQEEEIPIILDDTFVQYDNIRREKALLMINEKVKGQALIFTCHTLEKEIMDKNNLKVNYIEL